MSPSKKLSLLIIDPDTRFAEILSHRLESTGWKVKIVKNIEAAKKICTRSVFQMILIDPVYDFDFSELITSLQKVSGDPQHIVVLTARMSREQIRTWKKAGVERVLRKGSVVLQDLVKRLREYLV